MKQIWKWIIVIPIVIGIVVAGNITFKNQSFKLDEENKMQEIFAHLVTKPAEITKFYTYGTSLNIEGKINGITKDNFEGIKLLVTDGIKYKKYYKLIYSIENENNEFMFSSGDTINDSINLEELPVGKYYIQIRVKTNNSKDYKYYSLSNISDYKKIEYYTLTREGKNNKVEINFSKENYNEKKYDCLELSVVEAVLPENIYDFVIDSGHGGTDSGEIGNGNSESDLMLEYGKKLKDIIEEKGFKVKLTRDDNNTNSFTDTNMYEKNGRITIACESKAKYMISLHTGESGYSGIQVYVPNNVNFSLAEKLANNLYNNTSLEFSTNKDYKIQEGIYQKNYNKDSISRVKENLNKQGIEPYNLTTDTPSLYTIREVGGIATNAYVDGRNPNYSANEYYNSNQGIECYQISIGSLKKDKDILLNEMEQIINAISSCF